MMVEMFYCIVYDQFVIVEASTDVKTKASKISQFFVSAAAVARTLFENKVRPNTIETCFNCLINQSTIRLIIIPHTVICDRYGSLVLQAFKARLYCFWTYLIFK